MSSRKQSRTRRQSPTVILSCFPSLWPRVAKWNKLGNVWVFIPLIHRPKIICTKTQTLPNLFLFAHLIEEVGVDWDVVSRRRRLDGLPLLVLVGTATLSLSEQAWRYLGGFGLCAAAFAVLFRPLLAVRNLGDNSIDFKNCPKNDPKRIFENMYELLECQYCKHKKSPQVPKV